MQAAGEGARSVLPQAERQPMRATIAYDGTDFLGFQLQADGRTVQGVLEAALRQVTGNAAEQGPRVIGSGRTDAGVHATGQVVGFRVAWRHPVPDLQRALNAVLPADVVLVDLAPAAERWHARFSAVQRDYAYTVLNQPLRSPIERRYAHLVTAPLALERMQAAAALLVGEHDFASFGQPMRRIGPMQAGETTVRRIFRAAWRQEGRRLIFEVSGNAFLRGMVRVLVGSLLYVGQGRWPVERLAEVLAARQRALAAPPAPACGLCLVGVHYTDETNDE
jgi:tRNA pseudouridine38-40 synthase